MARTTRTRGQSKAPAAGTRDRRRPGPSSAARAAKNTPAILQAIVRTAARVCEAANAHIYRVDGNRLRLLAYSGSEPVRHVGQEVPITRELLSGQAVLDRRTIQVRDVQTAAARRRYPDYFATAKGRSRPARPPPGTSRSRRRAGRGGRCRTPPAPRPRRWPGRRQCPRQPPGRRPPGVSPPTPGRRRGPSRGTVGFAAHRTARCARF